MVNGTHEMQLHHMLPISISQAMLVHLLYDSMKYVNDMLSLLCYRLLGLDDAAFQALGTHCPGLQHLCIGHQGAEESIYQPEDYYCRAITDAAIIDLAQKCHQLT